MLQSLLPLLVLGLPLGAFAHERGQNAKRHSDLAKRAPEDVQRFSKRVSNARMTYYEVGLGACGIVNVPSDFIVAVSADEWDAGLTHGYPSDVCFKPITIEYNGVTAQATVTDRCENCPSFSGIDLSYDLFKVFAPNPEETGMIYANWWYNDGSGGNGGGPTSTSTSETSTWTPPPETSTSETSTWSPPPPETTSSSSSSSEWTSSESTTKKHHSSSSSSSEVESTSATATSTAAAAATSFVAGKNNVVDSLRQVVLDMGGIVVAAAGAQV